VGISGSIQRHGFLWKRLLGELWKVQTEKLFYFLNRDIKENVLQVIQQQDVLPFLDYQITIDSVLNNIHCSSKF